MDIPVLFRRLSSVVAVGITLVAVAACAIQLRDPGNDAAATQSSVRKTGTLEPDLARCRALTSEQGPAFEQCRMIWAGNRRRFFGHRTGSADGSGDDPSSSRPASAPKDQSRIPQSYPTVATPSEGDQ
ncbi:putative entry exclusion protein TrbK-alt [Bradyrhizobium sp. Pha-3]|uniref:putative entry exclusion protein TrbK-alt n=1 Tax=Bradyrhizobium sp. Pha-3 TaxID=208375 RepID=UPI0035D40581